MGDRDRPDGRADVGLGGDGLGTAGVGGDGAATGAVFGVDTLVLRIEEVPGSLQPGRRGVPRMARLREGRR